MAACSSASSWAASRTGRRCATPRRRWTGWRCRTKPASSRHIARRTGCASTPPERGERGLKVIIAGAGGAAHLPGMCAAWTPLPVLGVPVESHSLKGMDSLLSIVQMPAGIPVGTLAIGRAGAVNAALLAAAILATGDRGAGRAAGCAAARSRPRPWRTSRSTRRNDRPAAAERHHRSCRRRPAWPDVGACRRPARLSLPHPDPREGQPGQPGVGGDDHQRLPRTGRPSRDSPPRSMSSASSSRMSAPRALIFLHRSSRCGPRPAILRISQDRVAGEDAS